MFRDNPKADELFLPDWNNSLPPGWGEKINKFGDLVFSDCNIGDLKITKEKLPKLTRIDLNRSVLNSFEGLPDELPSLKKIRLADVVIGSLEGLPSSLPNLEHIEISNTNLESLKGFPQHLPKLRYLKLSNNKLK